MSLILVFSLHLPLNQVMWLQELTAVFLYNLTSDVSVLILANKIYVRSVLEYNSPVWNPWLIKCIERKKSVASLNMLIVKELDSSPVLLYTLQNFNFRSLEYRRMFCDLVQCYKIVYKSVDLPVNDFFPLT